MVCGVIAILIFILIGIIVVLEVNEWLYEKEKKERLEKLKIQREMDAQKEELSKLGNLNNLERTSLRGQSGCLLDWTKTNRKS